MKHLLLDEFGTTIDWIVVVIISILLVVVALFLFAFLYYIFKNNKKHRDDDDDDIKIEIPKSKTQVFLDNQNNSMPKGHPKCRYCGKEIKNLSGKCDTCGKYNFNFSPKKEETDIKKEPNKK